MKLAILASAAVIALVVALQPATAVDDAPNARVQLIEVEQQTPYLESFAGVTAGTATTSIIRRVAGITFSSQAYAQFDNHNRAAAARRSRSRSRTVTSTASRPRS